jgi:hypothetical protein
MRARHLIDVGLKRAGQRALGRALAGWPSAQRRPLTATLDEHGPVPALFPLRGNA